MTPTSVHHLWIRAFWCWVRIAEGHIWLVPSQPDFHLFFCFPTRHIKTCNSATCSKSHDFFQCCFCFWGVSVYWSLLSLLHRFSGRHESLSDEWACLFFIFIFFLFGCFWIFLFFFFFCASRSSTFSHSAKGPRMSVPLTSLNPRHWWRSC